MFSNFVLRYIVYIFLIFIMNSNSSLMAAITILDLAEKESIFNLLINKTFPEGITALYKAKLIRKSKHFEVHSGLLYFRRNDDVLLRFFCEHEKMDKLLAIMKRHEELAHIRRDKLIFDLKDRIYNARRKEIEEVLECCTICTFKRRLKTRQANRNIIASKVGERYQADLIDLRYYAKANDDFCWILNVIDVYSKYLMSIPLKSKNAHDVLRGFKKIFYLFGEPVELQTDNGKEFKNKVLNEYLVRDLFVKRIYGRARHPQSQGQIERCNQTLKNLLGNMVKHNAENTRWIDCHLEAVSIYNKTVHMAHGSTPYRMFFKREPGNKLRENNIRDLENNENEFIEQDFVDREQIENDPLEIRKDFEYENNLSLNDCLEANIAECEDISKDDINITKRRMRYLNTLEQQSTWKCRSGPIFARGAKVALYKSFDTNTKTKKRPFDQETDGKTYEVCNVHENGFIDIKDLSNNEMRYYVDNSRIRIIKKL